MKTFFTSDLHFGHKNAIALDLRPWQTVEDMNAGLIARWNAKVKKEDVVYVLGDFIWESMTKDAASVINSLNGKIILIKGNHDGFLKSPAAKNALFAVKEYDEIDVALNGGSTCRCVLSHYFIPFYNGHRTKAVHLHGHAHATTEHFEEKEIIKALKKKGYDLQVYNVGCMHWNYEPVTLDEILSGAPTAGHQ